MLSNFTLVKTVHFDLILTQINTNKTVLLHLGYRCIFSLCGASLKTHFSRIWVRKKDSRFLSGCELAGYRIIFSVYCNYSAGVLRETVYCFEWSDKPHVLLPPASPLWAIINGLIGLSIKLLLRRLISFGQYGFFLSYIFLLISETHAYQQSSSPPPCALFCLRVTKSVIVWWWVWVIPFKRSIS